MANKTDLRERITLHYEERDIIVVIEPNPKGIFAKSEPQDAFRAVSDNELVAGYGADKYLALKDFENEVLPLASIAALDARKGVHIAL